MMTPVILFAIAAVGGLVLAVQRFRGAPQPSLPIAIVHGLVAAAGLVSLLLAVVGGGAPRTVTIALVLFVLAALGGSFLFALHLQKKALPIPVVLIHALVAVSAFVLLLVAVLRPGL